MNEQEIMNIDRHNYETFFLLYNDNELSGAEKIAVEEFVAANPDLEEEFIMLQQSILIPEEIVLKDKGSLFRKEVDLEAYQEDLLLHLDKELKPEAASTLESLIAAKEELNKEWRILQQTRQAPDLSVVFTGKEILYRKEGGKRIAFPWLKLAAAAAFLGFVAWGGITYFNKDTGIQQGVVINDGNKKVTRQPSTEMPVQKKITAEEKPVEKIDIAATKFPAPIETTTKKVIPQQKPKQLKKVIIDEEMTAGIKHTNNLPQPVLTKINIHQSNNTVTTIVKPSKQGADITVPGKPVIEPSNNKIETANSFVTTASFTGDSEDKNKDHVFFMDEEKIKKTKLGGIFRKVKRVFERNANIKEGNNSIKVANLEFAIQ